jgi:Cu/Ag efflux pump CusA
MLRSIVRFSLKSRFLVIALAAGLIVFGVFRLRRMPVDVLPEFALPYVEVQTESLGLSAEEVEQLITVPMEQDLLNGVPWLKTIRSESAPGVSSVVMVFEPGTDLMRARQMVSERMTQAVALPHVSTPPLMLQPMSSTSRMMIVGLSSKSMTPIQLSVLAHWTIAPRLMGVPGVANVAIWGERERQLQVQVDPKRLKSNGVSLLNVLETAGNALWVSSLSFVEASTPGTGGFIETDNQRLGIRHILPIVSPQGLSDVPISGTSHRLGDVANVVEDHQPLIGDAITQGGTGLLLVIEKFPGASTMDVTHGVEEAFGELLPGLPGMEIDANVFRPANFIEAAIRNVGRTGVVGFLLAAFVLLAFLFSWRTALIAIVTIPASLVTAAAVLSATGASLNIVTATGLTIAIGAVICAAVADVQNILERLRMARAQGNGKSPASIILAALFESRGAVVYAALILMLAIAPVFFIGSTYSAFLRPLVLSYGLALAASFLVGLTLTPALALVLLSGEGATRRAPSWMEGLQARYEALLGGFVRRGGLAFAVAVTLTVVALGLIPTMHMSLLPRFKERDIVIELTTMPGTSQPEMTRISGRLGDELRAIKGVRTVAAHIGRAIRGDQVVNVNSAQLWVDMDPAASYEATAASIQHVVDDCPGVRSEVRTYLREKGGDVVAEAEDKVVVRLYGDEDEVLHEHAARVQDAIKGVPGVTDVRPEFPIRQATLETEVDIAAAQRYGLKPGDVRRAESTLISGIHVGSLFEEQKVFSVVVWSTPETRHSLSSVTDLMIDTPGGGHVRLGDVAKVRMRPAASIVRHEGVKRFVDIVVAVNGGDLNRAEAEIEARVAKLSFPLEYYAKVLGDYDAQRQTRDRLLTLWLAAAIGAFFLLQAAFGSWRLSALAVLTLPAAVAGGVVAAAATGVTTSLGLLAGLLALLGVAVFQVVLLIHRYQRLEREGGHAPGVALAAQGASERFRPFLISTLATGVALLPALLFGNQPGLEILQPMATVVLAGLASTALLHLFLLPAMYLSLGVSAVRSTDPLASDVGELALEVSAARAGVSD